MSRAYEEEVCERIGIKMRDYTEQDRMQRLKNYAHFLSRQSIDESVARIGEHIKDEKVAEKVIKAVFGSDRIWSVWEDGCSKNEETGKIVLKFLFGNDWAFVEVDEKTGEIEIN